MYCWFLAFLLQKWCSSILSCFIDRFLTNRTCRYSCLYWLARLPWFSDLFNLLTFSTITMYIGVTLGHFSKISQLPSKHYFSIAYQQNNIFKSCSYLFAFIKYLQLNLYYYYPWCFAGVAQSQFSYILIVFYGFHCKDATKVIHKVNKKL